ncbi:PstS family phosphate ABC transporter substrate-binding protein [Planctellipticum variicoloris]|uniref:PstS family phosphate ABC transporter substrate-binding protein n=1 Tax=Planctellipticum variicoloris TaxID=3064265 RepID=UPI0030139276|nr:PstS family phosphate ABC transporter substrate-binding protein [Planctomycetaceae bacterium SH412]
MKSWIGSSCGIVALLACAVTAGCVSKVDESKSGRTAAGGTTGGGAKAAGETTIAIDGSSTVYPISQAMAVEFEKEHADIRVTVGLSGTGGGFKKFIAGEIDISDASRPIDEKEKEALAEKGIEYLELTVAIDGLAVVVNPANDWAECMTVQQLNQLWDEGSQVKTWKELDPSWPDEKIQLFGADTDSGTFDYFTEVINGKAKRSRTEYTFNSNDNVLVQGVSNNKFALGYFGFAYYAENTDRLKVLGITSADGKAVCVKPSVETVEKGEYTPLARPLFIYVSKASLKRPEVAAFLKYYLSEAGQNLVADRKYMRINPTVLAEMQKRLDDALAAAK